MATPTRMMDAINELAHSFTHGNSTRIMTSIITHKQRAHRKHIAIACCIIHDQERERHSAIATVTIHAIERPHMPNQTTCHIASAVANSSDPNTHTTTNDGTVATVNSRCVVIERHNIARAKSFTVDVAHLERNMMFSYIAMFLFWK